MKSDEKIYTNSFGFYFPWHFQLFGLVLIVSGIFWTINSYGISLIVSLGGLLLLATTYKIKIDFDKKWYKSTYAIFGIDFSRWIELGNPKYVVLKKAKYVKTYSSKVNSMNIGESIYEVYLIFEELNKLKIYSNKKFIVAQDVANKIAQNLSIEVRNRTKNIDS